MSEFCMYRYETPQLFRDAHMIFINSILCYFCNLTDGIVIFSLLSDIPKE